MRASVSAALAALRGCSLGSLGRRIGRLYAIGAEKVGLNGTVEDDAAFDFVFNLFDLFGGFAGDKQWFGDNLARGGRGPGFGVSDKGEIAGFDHFDG